MSVAIDKPYPYVVSKSYPGTWRPHDKLLPDKSSDQLLAAKTSSSGCGYEKYTHCHAHEFVSLKAGSLFCLCLLQHFYCLLTSALHNQL